MGALDDFRAKYPGAYDDLSDQDLADRLYSRFYSDMPRDDFDARVGLDSPGLLETAGDVGEQAGNRAVAGLADLGGIVGDVDTLAGEVGNWIGNRVARTFGTRQEDTKYDPSRRITAGLFPTSDELKDATGFTERTPTTPGGRTFDKYIGPVVEAVPGAVVGGGGIGAVRAAGVRGLVRQAPGIVARGAVAPVVAGDVARTAADRIPGLPDEVKSAVETAGSVVGAVAAHGLRGPRVKGIRATAATQAKADIIERAIQRAEERGIGKPLFNREAALRAEFARIIRSPGLMAQFSPAEQAMVRQTADGKVLERLLMRLGTYAPENLNFRAATPYIVGSILGVPHLGAAVSVAAEGAKRVTSEMTKRAARVTHAMVREGRDRRIPTFPGVKPAAAVGVYTAAKSQRQRWELVDESGHVLRTAMADSGSLPPVPRRGGENLHWRRATESVK